MKKLVFKRYKTIRIESIYYYLALILEFVMIYPSLLSNMPGYNLIRIMQNGIGIISIVLIIKYIKVSEMRKLVYFFVVFLLSTIINQSSYTTWWYYFSKSFGLIIGLYFFSRHDGKSVFKAITDYFSVLIFLNTILSIIKPQGMIYVTTLRNVDKGIHLLGEKNAVIIYYIIGITLCFLWYEMTGENKRRIWFMLGCGWVSALIYMSSTSLIGLALFTLLVAVANRPDRKVHLAEKYDSILKPRNTKRLLFIGMLGILFGYYLLVIVRIQNHFNELIGLLFEKDATLSTRTYIWDVAIEMVCNSPVLGYGASASKYIILGRYEYNAHNIIIQILLMGGFLLLLSILILVSSTIKNISIIKIKKARRAIVVLYITYFIMSMAEFYPLQLMLFIIVLPIYIINIQKQESFRQFP